MPDDIPGKVIGVDEAGRGPVLGPLVVAGILTDDQAQLRKLGVKDSKALSSSRREKLFYEIQRICEVEVVIIPAIDIDSLRTVSTMNAIEANVFSKLVQRLLIPNNKSDEVTAILDAVDVDEKGFGRGIKESLKKELRSVPRIISEHRADNTYPAVSAASVIAKVTRDREMEGLRQDYGELGSGYPSDPITRAYLLDIFRKGKELPPFVRRSWETIKKIREEAGRKRIEDFFDRRKNHD